MGTIGETLGDARQDSGLSIEDVAHETHIHPTTIRSIEADDFSTFASVAYARSFIRKYAEFLEVDISKALEALNSGVTVRLGDNELMDEMKRTIKKDRRFRLEKRPRAVRRKLDGPGSAPLLLNCILGILIAALAIFYFLGFNAKNAEEAKQEITKGLQKANPFTDGPLANGEGEASKDSAASQSSVSSGNSALSDLGSSATPRPRLQAVDLSKPDPVETPKQTTTPMIVENGRAFFGPADLDAITSSLGEHGVSPATPKVFDQGTDIKKPEVSWAVEKPRPRPLAEPIGSGTETGAPPVRTTPSVEIEADPDTPAVPSIRSDELPALQRAREEPAAALRPEGTNPRSPEEEEAAAQSATGDDPTTAVSGASATGNVARAE